MERLFVSRLPDNALLPPPRGEEPAGLRVPLPGLEQLAEPPRSSRRTRLRPGSVLAGSAIPRELQTQQASGGVRVRLTEDFRKQPSE